jgi:hypothetical protein
MAENWWQDGPLRAWRRRLPLHHAAVVVDAAPSAYL